MALDASPDQPVLDCEAIALLRSSFQVDAGLKASGRNIKSLINVVALLPSAYTVRVNCVGLLPCLRVNSDTANVRGTQAFVATSSVTSQVPQLLRLKHHRKIFPPMYPPLSIIVTHNGEPQEGACSTIPRVSITSAAVAGIACSTLRT